MNMVVVQARMEAQAYESPEAFRRKVLSLTEQAVDSLPAKPTLLAFPEAIGFPLALTLDNPESLQSPSLSALTQTLLRRRWRAVLNAAWRYQTFNAGAFFLLGAIKAFETFTRSFAEAARQFGVTLVAGSSFLPGIDEEGARGTHISNKCLHNTAFTFAPNGLMLGRTHKVYLTPGLESRIGLTKGSHPALQPLLTPVGKLGISICLDGFFSSVIEQLDGLGTEIIVQPSANYAAWQRRWPPQPELSEEAAWFKYGLRAQIQNRLHIRYGLNPMLVGGLWGLEAQGRSSILSNTRYHPAQTEGLEGVLGLAETATEEGFVRVSLTADSRLKTSH